MLIVCVSSAASNTRRRKSIRKSWFSLGASATAALQFGHADDLKLFFVVSAGSEDLQVEQAQHGDMLLVDAAEGYEHLWRKTLKSLEILEERHDYAYYMHADDDSYVRLDLVLRLLTDSLRTRFYWGYIWDGTGNRHTAPIRNPRNKSHMPLEQYALDSYPPFASGCGFILSRDLVQALLRQPLPDYRLLDPPFGIHLCGQDLCVLPEGPIQPVHDDRVRPYRGIPIFKPTTIVQHYLTPEEMAPFHAQVLEHLKTAENRGAILQSSNMASNAEDGPQLYTADELQTQDATAGTAADALYSELVQLGLLRR